MRNMIQLVSGVAVAGVVAAGSTAFTAAGVTITPASTYMGGTATVSVTGATVSGVNYVLASATSLTRVAVTMSDANFNSKTMTIAFTGGTPANVTDIFTCTYNVANTPANTFYCLPRTAADAGASTFNPTGVSDIAITVL